MTPSTPYFIGCPVWTCREWIGPVFHRKTEPSNSLREYSKIFNTVEANTMFYALPPMATIERWMAESGPGFKFCPKFPKSISHERRLNHADEETTAFLKILETLKHGDRLGPSFLQLPPSFNANNISTLEAYLKGLPSEFQYAVEPRHVTWYDKSENERALDELLEELKIDKVIFDSRPLFSADPSDEEEAAAQSRKPQSPIRKSTLGAHPFLRIVGRNDISANEQWIKEWAPIINKWILEEKTPYIFTHCPDEANAPFFARSLHEQIKRLNPLIDPFPPFAGDPVGSDSKHEQLDLF